MSAKRPLRRNNHLEEAMALLLNNQAAFVGQIARNDREWLELKDRLNGMEAWQRQSEAWQRKTEQRLERIEASLNELPKIILRTVLEQLPKAVKKEIGFKTPG